VEQVVKLIRSKGVGVFFVTQNPLDVPDAVLAQLGNRIQHALRAYTPREEKAVKTAAGTFRPNPAFDTFAAITQLGVGEALVSMLEEKGVPSVVERTLIRPPASCLGPVTDAERRDLMRSSPLDGQYDEPVDRDSAHEILAERATQRAAAADEAEGADADETPRRRTSTGFRLPDFGGSSRTSGRSSSRRSYQRQTVAEAVVKSVVRAVGSELGRALTRGILGSFRRRR
jgi:uncharacterized protein